MNWIPVLSTLVTFVFAALVFNRYRYKKGAHLLFWGIGLIWYGIGTLTEVLLSIGFNPWVLKVWYFSGAMMTAAWLGQGTVYLLVRKPGVARGLAIGLVIISVLAAVLVFAAPISQLAAVYDTNLPASEQYKEILVRSGLITILTILLNIYGTITLVGGALYSAYLFWRKKILFHRVIGNILIAIGALFPAIAGSLVKAGSIDLLYFSELIGSVIMFIGFVQATSPAKSFEKKTVSAD